jgi:osmoprotectant transport system permease protein
VPFTQWDVTRYLVASFDKVWPRVVEHVQISVTSMFFALLIALPIGLLASRRKALANSVLGTLAVIYTIPSFALFAFLVPIMGIGPQPAVIALTAYALVFLVRNTVVGFNSVDRDVIEAARGMGMNRAQILRKIEVPLALPVVVAGVRIATLSTVGLATIAAWIGAGGLGQLLRDGMNDPTGSKLYAGVICVGVLAIGSDLLLRLAERLARAAR